MVRVRVREDTFNKLVVKRGGNPPKALIKKKKEKVDGKKSKNKNHTVVGEGGVVLGP